MSLSPCSHWSRTYHQFRWTVYILQVRESQSPGNIEIRWVPGTKPHITQLAWHQFKAWGTTQQTLIASRCFSPRGASPTHFKPLVLCIHCPVFILAEVFSLSSKVMFCFRKTKGTFCLVNASVSWASEQTLFFFWKTSWTLTLSSEIAHLGLLMCWNKPEFWGTKVAFAMRIKSNAKTKSRRRASSQMLSEEQGCIHEAVSKSQICLLKGEGLG